MALIKASPVGNRNYILLAAGEALPVGRWVRVGADGRAYLASGAADAARGIGFVKETVLTVNEIVQVQVSGELTLAAYDNAVPPNSPQPSIVYYQANDGYLTATESTYPVAVGLPDSQVLIVAGGGGGGSNLQTPISEWLPNTPYKANDLFYRNNVLYRVRYDHTSPGAFIAAITTGDQYEIVVLGQLFDTWQQNHFYVAGQCVVHNSVVYVCVTTHVADETSFSVDVAKWRSLFTLADPAVIQPSIKEWQPSTAYKVGELFFWLNTLYRVNADHTSAGTFSTEASSFYAPVVAGQLFDTWSGNTLYVAGNCVVVGNKVYICTTTHKSPQSPPATFATDASNWRLLFEFAPVDHTHSQYYAGTNFESLARISHDLTDWPTWMGAPWPGSRGCSVRRLTGTGTVLTGTGDTAVQFLTPMVDVVANYADNDYLADVTIMIQSVTDSKVTIKHSSTGAILGEPVVEAGDVALFRLKSPEVVVSGEGNFSYSYVVQVVYWLGGRADIKRKTLVFEGTVAEGDSPVQIFDCAAWAALYIDTPDYYIRAALEIESVDLTDQLPLSYVLSYNSLDMLSGTVRVATGAELVNPTWDAWKLRVTSGQYRIKVILTYIY